MIDAFIMFAAQVLTVDPATFELSPDRPEYCRKANGSEVDLQTVALLKNDKLDLRPYGLKAIVSIDGDWINVSATPGSPIRSYKQDIGYAALGGESLDVDLSIALYEGRVLLHWKETFKHREARLGLLRFKDDGHLETLCVGGPTVVVSH
jgi:hypothetical protein